MATGPALALLLAILAVGLVLLSWGAVAAGQWLRLWRRSRGAPRDGVAAVDGTCEATEPGHALVAPVSGREAFWYEVRLERDVGRPVRPQWADAGRTTDAVAFDLASPAGRLRVNPSGADLDVAPDDTRSFAATPEDLEDLAADLASVPVETGHDRLGVDGWDLTAGERYRLVERRLDPGDTISVTGYLDTDEGPAGRIHGPAASGPVRRLLDVPFVIADGTGDDGSTRLRNRVLVGVVFGLPLTLLAIVYLFPPGT